jgi:hypothetical protein
MSDRRSRPGATIVGRLALVAAAVVIAGPVGAATAIAGLLIARWRGYRSVAAAAVVALVLAAVLTVVEAPATGQARDYLFDFALDRPLAAEAGRVAGVFALVAVVLAAVRERGPSSASTQTDDTTGLRDA